MKKTIAFIFSLFAAFTVATTSACKPTEGIITIAVPDGAPTLALYSLMDSVNVLEGYKVRYKVLSGAENIGKTLVSGAADCAVMPVNVAAKLYNAGNDIKLLSVNVFGVLYLVGKNDLESLSDLKDKTIATIGKGATPDISLKVILDGNGIGYVDEESEDGKVTLTYVADAPTAMKSLATGKVDYAILGEPQATVACKNLGAKIVLDVQSEWAKIVGDNTFTQAGFVMNKNVYENKALADALFSRLDKNREAIMNYPEKVRPTVQKFGSSLQVDFTKEVLERCNLGCMSAESISAPLDDYFTAILNYDPTFIGGKKPDDGFYY